MALIGVNVVSPTSYYVFSELDLHLLIAILTVFSFTM